jgi:hypothetical protein
MSGTPGYWRKKKRSSPDGADLNAEVLLPIRRLCPGALDPRGAVYTKPRLREVSASVRPPGRSGARNLRTLLREVAALDVAARGLRPQGRCHRVRIALAIQPIAGGRAKAPALSRTRRRSRRVPAEIPAALFARAAGSRLRPRLRFEGRLLHRRSLPRRDGRAGSA